MTNAIIPHTQKIYTVQQIQHVCSRIFKIEQHKFVDDSFPENIENIQQEQVQPIPKVLSLLDLTNLDNCISPV